MNTSKLQFSILLMICILLSACVPAAATVVPSTISPITISPTNIPVTATPTSDPSALAEVAGKYVYKIQSQTYHMWLRTDGTYATLAGFGTYVVTPDQITFVDTLPASGTHCGSETGVYKWAMDNNKLKFVPINDNCDQRAFVLGSNTFEKDQDNANAPVEFVWRINGAPNTFVRPTRIAVDNEANFYVVDGGNQRIQKFDTDGKLLTMWGNYGDGDGQFMFRVPPAHFGAVAVDSEGDVYVTDYNSRVQKFDSNGKFLLKWGNAGSEDGQFSSHSDLPIAVDKSGNVYVADIENYRIQKFDSNGTFILKWGSIGSGAGEFGSGNVTDGHGPAGIAVDAQDNVYILDPVNYRIQKFDANGKFLNQWGSKGTGDGQFFNASEVAVDQQGNVYVTDNQQNIGGPTSQVSKFDGSGKFLFRWGGTGLDLGLFNYPAGIAVDRQGNIYVVSVVENVQKFKPK